VFGLRRTPTGWPLQELLAGQVEHFGERRNDVLGIEGGLDRANLRQPSIGAEGAELGEGTATRLTFVTLIW
jgi:hypothetical protein